MGQGDPGRQHQAAGMKSRPKIGKTFHNVSFGEIDTNRSGIGLARVGRPLGQRVTLIAPIQFQASIRSNAHTKTEV